MEGNNGLQPTFLSPELPQGIRYSLQVFKVRLELVINSYFYQKFLTEAHL